MTLIIMQGSPAQCLWGQADKAHKWACGDLNALLCQGTTSSEPHSISAMQGGWPGLSRTSSYVRDAPYPSL